MTDALKQLARQTEALAQKLSGPERKKLLAKMGQSLRQKQAERIRGNVQPDGSAMEPRKPQPQLRKRGHTRRRMFAKMVKTTWLKSTATPSEATVQFVGGARRIATVNHFGLRDRIGKKEVTYPERKLLGITDADISEMEDILLSHMTQDGV